MSLNSLKEILRKIIKNFIKNYIKISLKIIKKNLSIAVLIYFLYNAFPIAVLQIRALKHFFEFLHRDISAAIL